MQSLRGALLLERGSLASSVRQNTAALSQLSSPSRQEWAPVFDRASGLTYYWNRQTDETTALGARPPPAYETATSARNSFVSTRTVELLKMGSIGFGFGLILSVVHKIL